jgi:hypothetical protein
MAKWDHDDLCSRDTDAAGFIFTGYGEQARDLSDADLMKKVATSPDAAAILNPPTEPEPAPHELRRTLKQMLDDNELATGRLHSETEALTVQRVAISTRLEAIQAERAARVQMRNGLQAMIRNFGENAKP